MAEANLNPNLKVLEQCEVTPISKPESATLPPPLPLTAFDIIWYPLEPVSRVFFYHLPSTTSSDFLEHHLPNVKRCLSLTLSRFYPFAGRLVRPSGSSLPSICFSEGGDSVELTIAASDDEFHVLTANAPKPARSLRNLVPRLSVPPLVDDKGSPVLALQVTLFPQLHQQSGIGVAIGVTTLHAAADGASSIHFMKTWAAICRGEADGLIQQPFYDRSAVNQKTDGMAEAMMAQLDAINSGKSSSDNLQEMSATPDILRATFRLTKADIEMLRRRVSATGSSSLRFSSFSLSAGLAWATQLKARITITDRDEDDCIEGFIFPCDLRGRFDPPVPETYFGNLLSGCLVRAKRSGLTREDGYAVAAAVLQAASAALRDADGVRKVIEFLPRGWQEIAAIRLSSVAGSPRLGVYGVDFGWGKPCKVEVTSIEATGAFSLAESKDGDGGFEVGVVLPAHEMDRFAELFADAHIKDKI